VIVGSLLLILVAVVSFGLGLVRGSNGFLVMSIGASLLAAIAVVLGARQAAAARATLSRDSHDGLGDDQPTEIRPAPPSAERRRESGRRRGEGTVYDGRDAARTATDEGGDVLVEDDPDQAPIPGQTETPDLAASAVGSTSAVRSRHIDLDLDALVLDEHLDELDEEDPPDEPAAQIVPPADADRVALMSAEVLVIDGRPRYHQPGCVHLLGRESEALPVSEAVELGFTPCSLCEPDSALLAEARRG
jgi:hypothetical protein